jgi:DNA-binding PadR family transcriptional regulator
MATRRNLLALAVLAYLLQRPMHPYELGRTLRAHGDERSIKFNHGSLYTVVQQLEKAGFVEALETSREGQRPERTTYALTGAGREEVRDWLRDLVGTPRHEYPHFVAALSLIAALPPGEVADLLAARLERLAAQRAEIRELVDRTVGAGLHPVFLIDEEYRLALLDAETAFVQRFLDRLTAPETAWAPEWAKFHEESEQS